MNNHIHICTATDMEGIQLFCSFYFSLDVGLVEESCALEAVVTKCNDKI